MTKRLLTLLCLCLCGLLTATTATAQDSDLTRLLRFPDIHEDFVVFVYGGDIWRASSSGGEARRLTAHEGLELFPKISHDGRWVAYTAEYSGSRQVYVMPADGGASKQLTFYTDVGAMPPRGGWDYWIQGWTPDGKILVRMNRSPWGIRMGRYFEVDPNGGLEKPLVLPDGGSASLSPDGSKIAYCPVSREFRTWKRTRGGRAQDVWIYDFKNNRSERVTDDIGTDNFPLWYRDTIYFTSDREHTLNLFAYDIKTKGLRKVSQFDDYDVLWPSLGPNAAVFMNGGYIYKMELPSEKISRIPIRVGSDMPLTVPHFKSLANFIGGADVAPNGKRAVFGARGELFSVPAKHGATRRLSVTPGVRERNPAWSPDGKWIAYLSDATGEYELYVRNQDGTGSPRQLTKNSKMWQFQPAWSPDSEKIAFSDRSRRLFIVDVESGDVDEVDRDSQGDINTYNWSPDSRWLVYEKTHESRIPGIAIYSLDDKRSMMLGDGLTPDFSPTFSADGKHLFFLSNRDFNLRFSSYEFNYLYDRATRVYAAALDPSADPLFPIRSDEQDVASDDDATKEDAGDEKEGKGDKKKKEKEKAPLVVEPDGFVARTISLPGISSGGYGNVVATKGKVYYLRGDGQGPASIYSYDLKERKESKVLDRVFGFSLTPDGKKLFYAGPGNTFGIASAKPGLKSGAGKLDLDAMRMKIDPRVEWDQMYEDAWRLTRDWFYDPDMHGYDWDEIGDRYRPLVPHIAHRSDLDFIFGELIGELEAGHTYVNAGDEPRVDRIQGGKLGCEFELHDGRYRVARIFEGENWDAAYRSPLTERGVDVSVGEYILAINGQPLEANDNPYRLLEGTAGQTVELSVSKTQSTDDARMVRVRPVSSEQNLRYIDWVKSRMALVDKLSNGRIGYIHLPNTAVPGNRMLQKLFFGQANKEALIVDDRYNGGGFIPDRMIEYFSRTTLAYWARRDIEAMRTPGFAHDGPKVMLMNGYSSSGGDALPYFFKKSGLGKLIGTRTWGGLIGLTGNPSLVDGGAVIIPTFRIFDEKGDWVIENVGVYPDIEVIDLPELIIQGRDPSIEKGVEVLLDELKSKPATRPRSPRPPNLAKD